VKNHGKRYVHPSRYGTPKTNGGGRMREPEPLIDILEEKGEIIVVAEFVGFSRENLRINVKNQRLTLSAETPNRKYYKSLNLPKRVIPNAIRTTYKNGVLEIQLKKAVEEKTIDRVAG
jgi:HSP20 family protein